MCHFYTTEDGLEPGGSFTAKGEIVANWMEIISFPSPQIR